MKIREIIFEFGRSGRNFNNPDTPKKIARLGPYVVYRPQSQGIFQDFIILLDLSYNPGENEVLRS